MMSSVYVWLLSAVCAQLAAAQAPTQYNYPEFTGGYQAAGAAANRLAAAQTGGLAPAPRAAATGPGPYNAAAVAAGYNYPEFTGGYPARQQAPAQAYSPAPAAYNAAPAAHSPAQAAYSPAPAAYSPAAYSSAAAYDNGGYSSGSAYDNSGYNDGYQAQSGPSHYNYGYASDTSAKQEVRSPDGTVRGAYSYIDANGRTQKVEYVSDSTGFHVVRGTNLPQAPAPPPTA